MNQPDQESTTLRGFSRLLQHRDNGSGGIFLLTGGAGVGKTMYCRQFIIDALQSNEYGLFVSSSLDDAQFKKLFSDQERSNEKSLVFVNPYSGAREELMTEEELAILLRASLRQIQDTIRKFSEIPSTSSSGSAENNDTKVRLRVAVDSILHLILLFGVRSVIRFLTSLSLILNPLNAIA